MQEYILDTLISGVKTAEALDGEHYGFRVSAIAWCSGFRGALRLGDIVIACGSVRYARVRRRELAACAFGHAESQLWKSLGVRDGADVSLEVVRGGCIIAVTGKVLAERVWRNERGRYTLGPGGPERMASDGFSRPWADWLERQLDDMASRVLDDGWRRGTVMNSRQMLAEHLAQKPRVDFLLQTYPGPFASAAAEDWDIVRAALAGRRYELLPEDLGWRTLGAQRKAQIAAAAATAWEQYRASMAAQIAPAFPAVNAMSDERAAIAGKIVMLPRLGADDWTMDAGRAWLTARGAGGAYFIDSRSAGLQRIYRARLRYEKAVAPHLDETYQIVGRVGPNPKMLVVRGVAVPGLLVEPLAVNIGDAVFVDLSNDAAPFAGEEALVATAALELDDAASPAQVMEAFVLALKLGAERFWRELFAPWDAAFVEGQVWYQPLSGPASSNSLESEWIRARRLLEKAVCDVRVVCADPVRMVIAPDAFEGAPLIERTTVEVDHIGLFDGEYRAFKDINVTRLWPMQRRDGGPWRISIARGI